MILYISTSSFTIYRTFLITNAIIWSLDGLQSYFVSDFNLLDIDYKSFYLYQEWNPFILFDLAHSSPQDQITILNPIWFDLLQALLRQYRQKNRDFSKKLQK